MSSLREFLQQYVGYDPATHTLAAGRPQELTEISPHVEAGKEHPASVIVQDIKIQLEEDGNNETKAVDVIRRLIKYAITQTPSAIVGMEERAFGYNCYSAFASELKTDAQMTELAQIIKSFNSKQPSELATDLANFKPEIWKIPIICAIGRIGNQIDKKLKQDQMPLTLTNRLEVYNQHIKPALERF